MKDFNHLDKERSFDLLVFFLFGEPAFTQEHINLLRLHVHHLHLIQIPVCSQPRVIVTDSDLKHLTEIHRLNAELINLHRRHDT